MTGRSAAGRWGLLTRLHIGADGDPYLDRLRIIQTPWCGLYLHRIHRPDRDPDPHDHPWSFLSVILAGGYTEEVWPDKGDLASSRIRVRGRCSARWLGRDAAHIIRSVRGRLWTLVLVGPRRADWGFWTPDGFIGWRAYNTGARASANGPGPPQHSSR